jgi:hypothetical protein
METPAMNNTRSPLETLEEAFAELAHAIHRSNILLEWQEPRTSAELLQKKAI